MATTGATLDQPKYSAEEQQAREETKVIVLESISDMLENVWSQGETPRKKVVKQLLLKWHPDKNTEDDEELATAATQHIYSEVERLEAGVPRGGGFHSLLGWRALPGHEPRDLRGGHGVHRHAAVPLLRIAAAGAGRPGTRAASHHARAGVTAAVPLLSSR